MERCLSKTVWFLIQVKSNEVTFIIIVFYTMQIASKLLHINKEEYKMIQL